MKTRNLPFWMIPLSYINDSIFDPESDAVGIQNQGNRVVSISYFFFITFGYLLSDDFSNLFIFPCNVAIIIPHMRN